MEVNRSLYNLTADYEHVLGMLYDDDYDEQTVIDTLDATTRAARGGMINNERNV